MTTYLSEMVSYTVYILYFWSIEKFYVGYSNNIPRRIFQHNYEGIGFTAYGAPWNMVWVKIFQKKQDALILERKLEKLSKRRKVKFMIKHNIKFD